MELCLTTKELFHKGDRALSENIRDLFVPDYDACSCTAEIFDKDPNFQYLVLKNSIPRREIFGDRVIVPVYSTIDDGVVLNFLKEAIALSTNSINQEHLYLLQSHYKEYDVSYACLVGRENRTDIKPINCDKYIYLDIDGYYLLPESIYFGAYVCNYSGFGLFCIINNILKINES